MPDAHVPTAENRARLHTLTFTKDDGGLTKERTGDPVSVQFNPQSLTVNHRNRISTAPQKGSAQIVGRGNRTLDVTLFFDVTHPTEDRDDVRELTAEVRRFVVDREERDKEEGSKKKFIPPGVRFDWGSFQFDGMMSSLNESLDFFGPEGTPLRATVSIAIEEIEAEPTQTSGPQGAAAPAAGDPEARPPGAETTTGTSVQQLAGRSGRQGDWKQIAARNGIENPRSIHNPDAVDLSGGSRA